jgi:diazepam-binding inhibitor (GABA receptor modulator, acyl-CoA-binding protein)
MNEQFLAAVANSKTLSQKPDNETLLKLFSLYKQATEGDVNGEAPTNPFDFVAKAKYNAWEQIKGTTKEDAMQQYINLIAQLKG